MVVFREGGCFMIVVLVIVVWEEDKTYRVTEVPAYSPAEGVEAGEGAFLIRDGRTT